MMEDIKVKLKINDAYARWIDPMNPAKDIRPIFGDDVKFKLSEEENQIFKRIQIDGQFKFVGSDFDMIDKCSIHSKFTLEVYKGNDLMGYSDFKRTDCVFNYDDKICTVKLSTKDKYDKLLNNYDKTFNLIKLAPKREQIKLKRRAVLQLYVKGEDSVTNIVGGVYYEQKSKEVISESELTDTYHFGGGLPLAVININTLVPPAEPEIKGEYLLTWMGRKVISTPQLPTPEERVVYTFTNTNKSRFTIDITYAGGWVLQIWDNARGSYLAYTSVSKIDNNSQNITFRRNTDNSRFATAYFQSIGLLYGRLLLPASYPATYQRSMDDDITEYNSNYPNVVSVALENYCEKIRMNTDKTTVPTEWGIDSSERYFTYPTLSDEQKSAGVQPIPIGRSHWDSIAYWLLYDNFINILSSGYDYDVILKDSIPIWSAISVLLKKVDSNIKFGDGYRYSQFLSFNSGEDNRMFCSYDFLGYRSRLHITPISNIKKNFYEQAAQRGDISLKQVLDMLRKVYNCYWFIDSDNNLRIEHIVYFKNGNTYQREVITPTIDITDKKSLPTGESWGFGQNTIEYDTSKCHSRYEFRWANDCTYPFVGEPIDIKDVYIDTNRKESVTIENFLSDIDYIISNPSEISNDIYAVYEVNVNTQQIDIGDVRLNDKSPKYNVQNPYMTMINAERYYYPYNMSGWESYAGSDKLEVYKTKPIKRQKLACPLTLEEINSIGVVRTEVGDGLISDMNANINTFYANNTIMYEQERNLTNMIDALYDPLNKTATYRNTTFRNIILRLGMRLNGQLEREQLFPIPMKSNIVIDVTEKPVILNVEDLTPYIINRTFRKIGGAMIFTEEAISEKYSLTIKAEKSIGGYDWAGIYLTAINKIKVTISASCESNNDYGYISPIPCIGGVFTGYLQVSGTNTRSMIINAEQNIYIGYSKNATISANEDKIIITIEKV